MKSNEAVRTTSDILIRGSIMLYRCAVHWPGASSRLEDRARRG